MTQFVTRKYGSPVCSKQTPRRQGTGTDWAINVLRRRGREIDGPDLESQLARSALRARGGRGGEETGSGGSLSLGVAGLRRVTLDAGGQ